MEFIMKTQQLPDLMENPRFRELIDGFSEVIKTSSEQGLAEARKRCTEFFLNADPFRAEVKCIDRVEIKGKDNNSIPLNVYTPQGVEKPPVILYFHRGGWIFGNITEADPVCRLLAQHLEAVVISVGYRLSPENPFPKPLEDCYAATVWAAEHAGKWGADVDKLIVCGESAGGNLAAAVSLMARDFNEPAIAAQLLIYPIITAQIDSEPYDSSPDRHFLTKEAMQFIWGAYLQSEENGKNPYASVDRAVDLSRLPPAVVVTGEYDPLHVEGSKYAEALKNAGVMVQSKCFGSVIHGFLDLPIYDSEQKIGWTKQIKVMLDNALKRN